MKIHRSPKTEFKKGHQVPDEWTEKNVAWHLGKRRSIETKNKIREHSAKYWLGKTGNQVGERHWNWKGGISPISVKIRDSGEYARWRWAVFRRDDYTCQICGRKKEVSGKLTADHILPFSMFPELRFVVSNGRTLCRECHINTPTWGGKLNRPFQDTWLELIKQTPHVVEAYEKSKYQKGLAEFIEKNLSEFIYKGAKR